MSLSVPEVSSKFVGNLVLSTDLSVFAHPQLMSKQLYMGWVYSRQICRLYDLPLHRSEPHASPLLPPSIEVFVKSNCLCSRINEG